MLIKSFCGGLCIGLGCWLSLSASNPLIGALLFSCGLIAIRIFKYNLFTGKIQFMLTNQLKKTDYCLILGYNLLGILLMYILSSSAIHTAAQPVGLIKSSQSFLEALSKGIGCGMLMTLATYKETPLYITILCVFGFVASGFNHCIADAFYLLHVPGISINWFATLFGNIIGGLLIKMVKDIT